MSLIGLVVFVIIIGLLYWCITILPLPAPFKTIATVLLIIIAILYLVSAFGVLGPGFATQRLWR